MLAWTGRAGLVSLVGLVSFGGLVSLGGPLLAAEVKGMTMESAKAEPNLEKRSEAYLLAAEAMLLQMKEGGSNAAAEAGLERVRQAADLSYASLKESGRNARKNPKYFKKAEAKLRELRRRVEGLKNAADLDERPKYEGLVTHLSQMEDHLVQATTTGEMP